MITLAWPGVLGALVLPLLVRWISSPVPQVVGAALRLPIYRELVGLRIAAPGRRRLAGRIIASIAWLLLVVTAARPQWLGEPIAMPLAGRDLMLAVDVSGSMEQADYSLDGRAVTRLDVVKTVGSSFIERRNADRLGLILFGSRAYLQTPLTYDRDTVVNMLQEAVIGLAGRETALGDAIVIAVKRLRDQPEDNRVLILLTDGANTAGSVAPADAAQLAAQTKVRIYTIGIGGGQVGMRTPFGTLLQPGSDLDMSTLKAVAESTGGRAFQATDTAQLEAVYEELDRLEPSVRDARSYRPMRELYVWPAGAALLLSLGLALARLSPPSRKHLVVAGEDRHAV